MDIWPVVILLSYNHQRSYANAPALSLVLLTSHNFVYYSVSTLTF